jgi:hypothetical protein
MALEAMASGSEWAPALTSRRLTPLSKHDPGAHAIIPLAVFESMRSLDLPAEDGVAEFHHDLTAKRLGTNRTVLTQIERYTRLAEADKRVAGEEAAALLRLVGRRSDAGLVFADAGRRAGRHAAGQVGAGLRLLWSASPVAHDTLGLLLVRSAAAKVFGARLAREQGLVVAAIDAPLAVRATPDGAACGFYCSAVAELLRTFTTFDGALLHVACRAKGDTRCYWRAGLLPED